MSADGDFWRTVKANTQAEYLLISVPANSQLTYTIDGESFTWTEYKKFLLATIENCDAKIAAAEPFEFEQRGMS